MDDIRIAPAAPSDWPAIAGLLTGCGLPLEGARDHLADFLVATTRAGLVGVIGMERHGGAALLRSFATAREVRGQGLGARLLAELEGRARQAGIPRLHLLTTTAQAYFQTRGYAPQARASAPAELADSAEFQGACPASAIFMGRMLTG
jgi:amino-acid N-acetyltransferase